MHSHDTGDLLQETREKNIERILRDGVRIREGQAHIAKLLDQGKIEFPATAVMVDLDGSATVRRAGIEAKVELVLSARDRIREALPDDAVLLDSGTRDETHVVLPGQAAGAGAVTAENVRRAIAAQPFSLTRVPRPVAITASVGHAVAASATAARTLLADAREAQFQAKVERNTVRQWTGTPATEPFTMPSPVVTYLSEHGASWDSVTTVGLDALEEKLGGLWHWCVDQGADQGTPTRWDAIDSSGVEAREVLYFRRLHESVVFEALTTRSFPRGHGYRIQVDTAPAGNAVHTAQYLPGQWVSAVPDPTAPAHGPALARVAAARWTTAGASGKDTTEVALPWSPSRAARLHKLQVKHGLSAQDLLVEASVLAADRAALGLVAP
ncbi:hypothetical protein AB0912_31375 [Streptomyces sp. NPDC007084]|uniref:hypothetical protein n=1 Tax=Streptomyces sp. NPDC007084 TaxID=3154313 RepID=UPI003454C181